MRARGTYSVPCGLFRQIQAGVLIPVRFTGRPPEDGDGGQDVGPKGELEYWRNRMQRLTSITEQLKRKVRVCGWRGTWR